MVKLRLQRRGRKKLPFYKIVAADSRAPRDGRFIESIGEYNPVPNPAHMVVDQARALYWLGKGAQPTDTVRNIFSKTGILLHRNLIRKGMDTAAIEEALGKWKEEQTARLARTLNKKQARALRKKAAEPPPAEAPTAG